MTFQNKSHRNNCFLSWLSSFDRSPDVVHLGQGLLQLGALKLVMETQISPIKFWLGATGKKSPQEEQKRGKIN